MPCGHTLEVLHVGPHGDTNLPLLPTRLQTTSQCEHSPPNTTKTITRFLSEELSLPNPGWGADGSWPATPVRNCLLARGKLEWSAHGESVGAAIRCPGRVKRRQKSASNFLSGAGGEIRTLSPCQFQDESLGSPCPRSAGCRSSAPRPWASRSTCSVDSPQIYLWVFMFESYNVNCFLHQTKTCPLHEWPRTRISEEPTIIRMYKCSGERDPGEAGAHNITLV